MSILATPEEISNLKHWTRHEMPDDTWVPVNEVQQSAFKHLMTEWYGWPEFSLNFLKDMKHVIKIML